jgi:predicted kinase
MSGSFLVILTGLPASGKTTLAMQLAGRYRVPLISKDLIKEALLDVIGAADAGASRRLSDASFRVLTEVADAILAAQGSCILDGNFRAGEHEPLLIPLLARAESSVQILCRIEEAERISRLRARARDRSRHRGHRDLEQAAAPSEARPDDRFLDLPGARILADARVIETLDVQLSR